MYKLSASLPTTRRQASSSASFVRRRHELEVQIGVLRPPEFDQERAARSFMVRTRLLSGRFPRRLGFVPGRFGRCALPAGVPSAFVEPAGPIVAGIVGNCTGVRVCALFASHFVHTTMLGSIANFLFFLRGGGRTI